MFQSHVNGSVFLKNTRNGVVVFSLISSSLFGAGYLLPSGTILYDDTSDHTLYRVDKMTPV